MCKAALVYMAFVQPTVGLWFERSCPFFSVKRIMARGFLLFLNFNLDPWKEEEEENKKLQE